MKYKFSLMTEEQAETIAYDWHYDGKYSFYDMEADQEDLEEFLDPEERGESTFAVTKNNELIGFFSVDKVDDQVLEIGLGMRPDLTGKGMGENFIRAGMEFLESTYQPNKILLAVATFNQRAIKVYRKIGFMNSETFMQDTNGSTFEFLKMVYDLDKRMNLGIKNIDRELAKKILSWRYEAPYDFYNNQVNEEGIRELLDGSYFAVTDENGEVFGFFCTGKTAQVPAGHEFGVYQDTCIDLGLGMHPDYVGNGYGIHFLTFILGNLRGGNPIRLSVATFNQRAIRLYEKVGFERKGTFQTDAAEFLTMVKVRVGNHTKKVTD